MSAPTLDSEPEPPAMPNAFQTFAAAMMAFAASAAQANDLEGVVEAVNPTAGTLTVQGIVFHVTPTTDFDRPLRRLADLTPGQRVEVDFVYRDGKHIATEIELDD